MAAAIRPPRKSRSALASAVDEFSDLDGPGLRFSAKTQSLVKTVMVKGKPVRVRRAENHIELCRDISQHNLRMDNQSHRHRVPHDAGRSHLNEILIGQSNPDARAADFANALAAHGIVPPRVDSVTMLEIVVQCEDGGDCKEFWMGALDAVREIHPGLPILSADIHRDQSHPHMHVVLIGIRDGTLVGSRGLSDRENSYKSQWQRFMAIIRHRFGLRPDRPDRKAKNVKVEKVVKPTKTPLIVTQLPCPNHGSGQGSHMAKGVKSLAQLGATGQGSSIHLAGNPLAPCAVETPSLRTARQPESDLCDVFRQWASLSGCAPCAEDEIDDGQREAFEERAAIMEFDGGMTRAQAEAAARQITYVDGRADDKSHRDSRAASAPNTRSNGAVNVDTPSAMRSSPLTATTETHSQRLAGKEVMPPRHRRFSARDPSPVSAHSIVTAA